MTRHRQLKIATIFVFCLLLVIPATVPAFASDEAGDGATGAVSAPEAQPEPAVTEAPVADPVAEAPEPAPAPATAAPRRATSSAPARATLAEPEPAAEAPSTDPTDGNPAPTDPTGSTGATGGTGGTGATGPTGPVVGGVDENPVTPPAADNGAPPTSDGTNPPASSDDGDPPRSTGTLTEDNGSSGADNGDAGSDSATAGVVDSATLPAAPTGANAGDLSSSGDLDRAARSTVERAADNADTGVVASLVVTRIINKIPAWVAWALAALSIAAIVGLGLFWRERRKRRFAEEDAMVDELTGISNRKAFDRRLDLEWRRAARYGRSLGLMVMDLDGFKQVNDLEGHAEGDRVLRSVAQALDSRMRDTDLVARIGGDEFAVICPETGINELMTIRRHLGEQATAGLAEKIGLSIGVAEYVPGDEDPTSIVARADESMYRVKRGEALSVPA